MEPHNFTYLSLMLLTVLGPLLLMFDKRSRYVDKMRSVIPAAFLVAIPFIIWDIYFTEIGIWSFNKDYTLPVDFFGLPPGEVLFFFAVPFSCLFIFVSIEYYLKDALLKPKWSKVFVSLGLIGILFGLLNQSQIYTLVIFVLVGLFFLLFSHDEKVLMSKNFWYFTLFSFLGFFLINTILTALPVVSYDNFENLDLRLGTIPIEDFLYSFLLTSLVLVIFRNLEERKTIS